MTSEGPEPTFFFMIDKNVRSRVTVFFRLHAQIVHIVYVHASPLDT